MSTEAILSIITGLLAIIIYSVLSGRKDANKKKEDEINEKFK